MQGLRCVRSNNGLNELSSTQRCLRASGREWAVHGACGRLSSIDEEEVATQRVMRMNDFRLATGIPGGDTDREARRAALNRVPKCPNAACGGRHSGPCPVPLAKEDPTYDAARFANHRCNYEEKGVVCRGFGHLAKHHNQLKLKMDAEGAQ